MKLSTRSRYGTRALLDIALHAQGGKILLRDVAQRQQISPMYLEHIITPLVATEIIKSTRGAKGGVSLAKPAEQINLSEVIRILEGSITLVECINNPNVCSRSKSCVTRDVWGELKKAMDGVLENLTLQDLVEQETSKEQSKEPMYYI
ncbi:RrF2 family transcriptional regulator [Chloroflexota bacterium]